MHAHHASFLPQILVRHARDGLLQTGDGAFSRLMPSVLLFTDVSGFTALTERFAAENAAGGAEQLTDLLNQYFDPLIRCIHAYGGDIIKFAGDAMLILWEDPSGERLPHIARAAIACGHDLQRIMRECATRRGESLSMKAAVSVGDVRQVCLGGVLGRRDMLLTGSALSELGRANDYAKPGDVIICGSAVRTIAQATDSSLPPVGPDEDLSERLGQSRPLVDPVQPGAQVPDDDAASALLSFSQPPGAALPVTAYEQTDLQLLDPDVDTAAADILRTFIPAAIRKALDVNQADWVSENRLVSLLFVNLRDFTDELPVDFEQTAMRAVQKSIYQFEGSLNKISVDDKGVCLLGAFGMPPFRHSDDPLRAVRAASAIVESLKALGLSCAIGVTTGRVYCGVVGNGIRREYTLMGDMVNLSARLMGNALKRTSGLPVMVDERTWQATHDKLPFGEQEALKLKGKANPVPAWQLAQLPASTSASGSASAGAAITRPLRGRDAQLRQIQQAGTTVLLNEGGLLLDISGPVGSGRRHLSRVVLEELARDGFMVWRLSCSAMQQFSPWQTFAPIFKGLLPQRGADESLEAFRQRVSESLPSDDFWQQQAPLLEAVVPAQWPDTPQTAALSGDARVQATHAYLARLMQLRMGRQPVCIRIRDVEWMDRASVELCRLLLEQAQHLLLLCLRDSEFTQTGFWSAARDWPQQRYQGITLEPLPAQTLLQIASEHLDFANPPAACLRLLDERANGSPLHAIQILGAVKEAGDQFNMDELPASIEGLIISRIDRLSPETALTGKIISVAILDMELPTLRQLHPSTPRSDELLAHCHALQEQGFVRAQALDASQCRGLVQFAHVSTQQTFYSLLPAAQRRALHQRVATAIEQQDADASALDQRTYHWLRACETRMGANDEQWACSVSSACAALLAQARRNTRFGALMEAEQQFQHVTTLSRTHGLMVTRDLEIDALLGLSSVRFSRFGWADSEAAQALEQARTLCEGSQRRLPVFSATRGLWQICVGRSDYQRALLLAHEMSQFALATSQDDPGRDAMRAEASRALGTTCFWLGQFDQAEHYLKQTLDIPDVAQGDGLNLTQDTRVTTLGMLAWTLAVLGKTDETLATADRAVNEAQQRGGSFSLAYVHGTAMWACLHVNDVERASYHAQQTLQLSESKGFEYLATAARVVFGWARAWGGDPKGIDDIASAIERWRARGQSIGIPAFSLQWARALQHHGRFDQARAVLDGEAFQQGLKTEPWISTLAQRMLIF